MVKGFPRVSRALVISEVQRAHEAAVLRKEKMGSKGTHGLPYAIARKRVAQTVLQLAGFTDSRENKLMFHVLVTPTVQQAEAFARKRGLLEIDQKKVRRLVSVLLEFQRNSIGKLKTDYVSNSVAYCLGNLEPFLGHSSHPIIKRQKAKRARIDAEMAARVAEQDAAVNRDYLALEAGRTMLEAPSQYTSLLLSISRAARRGLGAEDVAAAREALKKKDFETLKKIAAKNGS